MMKRTISVPLTKKETILGALYLFAEFALFPGLFAWGNSLLPTPLDDTKLNFVFYVVNFLSIAFIFRRFLSKNLESIRYPFYFLQVVIVGLAQYLLLNQLMGQLIFRLDPGFYNANDAAIAQMVDTNLSLMAIATIILVPLAEECLFRGLIFRNLYDISAPLAWVVSVAGFSAIHLVGFLGTLTPMELLISFLQYVPAGISLAWAYSKADSIFAPILIHAMVNAIGINIMRL